METPRGVKRTLAAIFSADVAGYSRLMAEDEVATLQGLTAERELMTDLVRQHHGRVVGAKATSTPSAPSLPRPGAPVPRPSRPQPSRRPLEP